MNIQNINMFLANHGDKFEPAQLPIIQQRLEMVPDEQMMFISAADFKSPTTMLVVSLVAGGLGIDRFLLGDTGMGILKLLTGGCFGILTIIDWFTIMDKTKKKNFEQFMMITSNQPPYQQTNYQNQY